ncbi:MAG: helix-turn-helix transcriptional regulator [Candidatus Tectomicrobia bacterium]|uniref:Helix-turn-helix transcriptional regulator n=1 Tax=Tectimicrobiota bacterium TaxID=2528274 RepID=A0A932CPE3_UNCTE|nr:helix-turn-helix transcriptional regulator [Candidatus Tectomicrobia bacterium]
MLEIVLLGLLMEGSRHGYEMKKIVEEELVKFVDISSGPIYYTLKSLEKRGLVTKRSGQIGRRPERFVYEITDRGRREFKRLLGENFISLQRPFLNIDLSLYFLKFLEPHEIQERLEQRLKGLRGVRQWASHLTKELREGHQPFYWQAIAEHALMVVQVEIDFLQNFIRTLRSVSCDEPPA